MKVLRTASSGSYTSISHQMNYRPKPKFGSWNVDSRNLHFIERILYLMSTYVKLIQMILWCCDTYQLWIEVEIKLSIWGDFFLLLHC